MYHSFSRYHLPRLRYYSSSGYNVTRAVYYSFSRPLITCYVLVLADITYHVSCIKVSVDITYQQTMQIINLINKVFDLKICETAVFHGLSFLSKLSCKC